MSLSSSMPSSLACMLLLLLGGCIPQEELHPGVLSTVDAGCAYPAIHVIPMALLYMTCTTSKTKNPTVQSSRRMQLHVAMMKETVWSFN